MNRKEVAVICKAMSDVEYVTDMEVIISRTDSRAFSLAEHLCQKLIYHKFLEVLLEIFAEILKIIQGNVLVEELVHIGFLPVSPFCSEQLPV